MQISVIKCGFIIRAVQQRNTRVDLTFSITVLCFESFPISFNISSIVCGTATKSPRLVTFSMCFAFILEEWLCVTTWITFYSSTSCNPQSTWNIRSYVRLVKILYWTHEACSLQCIHKFIILLWSQSVHLSVRILHMYSSKAACRLLLLEITLHCLIGFLQERHSQLILARYFIFGPCFPSTLQKRSNSRRVKEAPLHNTTCFDNEMLSPFLFITFIIDVCFSSPSLIILSKCPNLWSMDTDAGRGVDMETSNP